MKKINLKEAIHKIQDGIENVHGDVEYGEKQYFYLFQEWSLRCIGQDDERKAPKQWAYRVKSWLGEALKNKPDIKIWIEDNEYIRGWNARAELFKKNIMKITKDI